MSVEGALDLRIPIGALFTVLGVLLGGYGLATHGDAAMYARATDINVNLIWGIVMLVFGALMLLGARRSARSAGVHLAQSTPEGRATEERERRTGLER